MPSLRYIESVDFAVVRYMGKLGFPIVHRGLPTVDYGGRSEYMEWDNSIQLQEDPPSGELMHLAHELVHSHQVIPQQEVSLYYMEDGSVDHEVWKASWFEQQAEAVAKLVWLQFNGYHKEVSVVTGWSIDEMPKWCHIPIDHIIKWANL